MDPLQMVPSCALDESGARVQLERYREMGRGARMVSRNCRRLVVDLEPRVDGQLVDETIAVERECCPFFDLDWDPDRLQLTFSVSRTEHEPALDAIAFALDVEPTLQTR
jgi:hypothetical protein